MHSAYLGNLAGRSLILQVRVSKVGSPTLQAVLVTGEVEIR